METFTRITLIERMKALPAHVVYGQLLGREDWGNQMQRLVPEHMRQAVIYWIAFGIAPGHFLSSVLRNDLFGAYGRADDVNARSMQDWVTFLYNYAPRGCFGSESAFNDWEEEGGLIGRK